MLLLFILFSFPLKSQSREDITGEVKDKAGGLSGVVITVTSDAEDDVLSYTITDNAGKFELKNVDTDKGRFIRARLMGFANQTKKLEKSKTHYLFTMTEEAIELNEVMIQAPKISGAGDTTRYLASAFARENDITLGDLLKRMPGFQVSDEGRIKYEGKDISDFYIEGSDIMGSKYPVAVSSIHQGDVGSVEVIENHQSIKLFEDLLFSDNTAVNISLKEKAKNKWVGLLNLGGGIPKLWSADVNAMRFAERIKILDTYKGNNTGNNVSAIGKAIINLSGEAEADAPEIISMRDTRNPFLEQSKTLFNRSHLLSLNNQLPISKSFILTPQLDIGRSLFDNDSREERTYFLDNGETYNISTREKGLTEQWEISPILRLEANTRKMYVNNVLTSNIVRKKNNISITGTYPNEESARSDYVNIRNNLDVMFRFGQKVMGVKSVNSWIRRPQQITIEQNSSRIEEDIETSVFNSQTSTSQSFAFGQVTLSLEEGYSFSRSRLQSLLTGVGSLAPDVAVANNFDYRKLLLYVKPSLSINLGAVKTTLSVPVSYHNNDFTDKRTSQSYSLNKWMLSPSASASWSPGRKFTFSVNGGWRRLPEEPGSFYSSGMLSSYPFVQSGLLEFNHAQTAHAGMLIRYKNILHGLFWNVSFNRMWRHDDLISTQDFEGDYVMMGFVRDPRTTKNDIAFGSISYMMDLIKGGFTLRGMYSNMDSYFRQSGELQHSFSSTRQASLNVYSSPLSVLDIDYTVSFTNSAFRLQEQAEHPTNTVHQKLSLTLSPIKKWNAVISGSHYFHTLPSGNDHTFLLDAYLNFTLSSKWSLRLSAGNLFNQNDFSYITYTDKMSIANSYRIRPFSLLISVITSF